MWHHDLERVPENLEWVNIGYGCKALLNDTDSLLLRCNHFVSAKVVISFQGAFALRMIRLNSSFKIVVFGSK